MSNWEMIMTIVCFCLGLRAITDDNKIGFPIREFFLDRYHLPFIGLIASPLILCCTCMASIWGTVIFWWIHLIHLNQSFFLVPLDEWVFCCMASAFFNGFFWSLFEKLK